MPCRHLAYEHGRRDCIFISYIASGQISVPLFKPENISFFLSCLFQYPDLFSYIFESNESFFYFYLLFCCHMINYGCAYYGSYGNGCPGKLFVFAYIIKKQGPYLIARKDFITVSFRNRYSHSVTVGIRGHYKVSLYLSAKPCCQIIYFRDLGIRIGTCGETAVRIFLFFHYTYTFQSRHGKQFFYWLLTCSVQWCIYKSESFHILWNGIAEGLFYISFLYILRYEFTPFFQCLFKCHAFYIFEYVRSFYKRKYFIRDFIEYLASLTVINFVSVVFF